LVRFCPSAVGGPPMGKSRRAASELSAGLGKDFAPLSDLPASRPARVLVGYPGRGCYHRFEAQAMLVRQTVLAAVGTGRAWVYLRCDSPTASRDFDLARAVRGSSRLRYDLVIDGRRKPEEAEQAVRLAKEASRAGLRATLVVENYRPWLDGLAEMVVTSGVGAAAVPDAELVSDDLCGTVPATAFRNLAGGRGVAVYRAPVCPPPEWGR
jgi:hypothetical protein